MSSVYSRSVRVCSQRLSSFPRNKLTLSIQPFTHFRSFGKYAKYEKPPVVRLRFQKHFYGWKKYLVIAYNIGLFKLARYGITIWVIYKFWNFFWPIIKWGTIIGGGAFVFLFWLRFWAYRRLGPAGFEQYKFSLCSTRYEKIYEEFDHLSTGTLALLVHKTWIKSMIFRNHRRWLRSIQHFLNTYKPMEYYMGKEYENGISYRPFMIEHEGYFKSYYTWFVSRKEGMGDTYGWIDCHCEGNLHSKVVTVRNLKLNVHPKEGGEVLKFKPFRITIDDEWNAQLLDEHVEVDDEEEKENKVRHKLQNKKNSPIHRKKKPVKVADADYTMKK